jgi:hypothetical protein
METSSGSRQCFRVGDLPPTTDRGGQTTCISAPLLPVSVWVESCSYRTHRYIAWRPVQLCIGSVEEVCMLGRFVFWLGGIQARVRWSLSLLISFHSSVFWWSCWVFAHTCLQNVSIELSVSILYVFTWSCCRALSAMSIRNRVALCRTCGSQKPGKTHANTALESCF